MSGFYEVTTAPRVRRRRETDPNKGTTRPAKPRVIPPPAAPSPTSRTSPTHEPRYTAQPSLATGRFGRTSLDRSLRRLCTPAAAPTSNFTETPCVYRYVLRTAIALCVVAAATGGCAANRAVDCSGPCTESHHIWSPTGIAADLSNNPFPPAATRGDHLSAIHCQITHGRKRREVRRRPTDGPVPASPHHRPNPPARQRLMGSDLLAESVVAVRAGTDQGATRPPAHSRLTVRRGDPRSQRSTSLLVRGRYRCLGLRRG
jgi:hypothetical protein